MILNEISVPLRRLETSGSLSPAKPGLSRLTGPVASTSRGDSAGVEKLLLRFHGLQKCYGSLVALDQIELSISAGTILALLGPNGAGKSTLFGCLLGLTRSTAGSIHVDGQAITELHRHRMGYLPERVCLYPQRTVRDNGLFFARLKRQSPEELQRQLQRVGLADAQNRPVRQLSKGMLQRLGLAIALCGQPELLVLDEPFNGLDPALLDGLQQILREEHQRGATLLISTHTMSAVEPLATHVAVLLGGRLVLSQSLAVLRAQYPQERSLEALYHRLARQQRSGNPPDLSCWP